MKAPLPKPVMTTDNSTGKHTQIVQVLIPQPEPKKQAPKRRIARKAKVEEALTEPVPPLFNGYKPIYSTFSPVPSFSPSIDISYGGEKEPPKPTATVPPIEVEEPIKAPAPKKKGSKLKGVLKGIGKGIASAVEAIGELPTQQPSGLTPLTPPPVIPVEAYNPDYIPPREMPEFQMYQPSPYLLTGEPMTREGERTWREVFEDYINQPNKPIQTEAPRATTETGTGGTPIIYAQAPPKLSKEERLKAERALLKQLKKNEITKAIARIYEKAKPDELTNIITENTPMKTSKDLKSAGLKTKYDYFKYILDQGLEQKLYDIRRE